MVGMMVVLVPELREAEWEYDEALKEELSSLLENSYDGIVVADKDCIRKVNASFGRITGLPPSFLINKKIKELDKDRHVCLAAVKEVIRLAQHHKKTITLQKRIRSGNEIFLTSSPVLNRHGRVDRVVLNVRDITELKALENQIKKLSGLRLNREDAANHRMLLRKLWPKARPCSDFCNWSCGSAKSIPRCF
jgi:PAS domain S-box-containing protein